ncbi:hypothetical protein PENANT_c006G03920 [Penicillium antarcticum]|uniref:Uncharacterized protein n=1 Tax=Penicillium antarcticum TaxID=416450 RepID=A0A1V6QD80_9EURO|nr:hypothetical protein PENANT_c006G03920 [Penicillium antarcticum]
MFASKSFAGYMKSSAIRGKRTYTEVIGEMLLLEFAFIYTSAYGLYGAIAELAHRPEYIAPLREEINAIFAKTGTDHPISERSASNCIHLQPPCTHDLKLSNGTILKQGSPVASPSGLIQCPSPNYENPNDFDGSRFVKRTAAGAKNSRLVDLSPDYLALGMGAHAW